MHPSRLPCRNNGFSLVELAIVLVIVALLTSGLLLGISAQRNAAENIDAQRQLENIRDALTGFALTTRPPALSGPAQPSPIPTPMPGSRTVAQQHGVLPWVTLGLPETDPWGQRFTYYANSSFTATLPSGALASFTLDTDGNANIKASASSTSNVASNLPAVVVSHGSRGAGAWQPERHPIVRCRRRRTGKCQCQP